MHIRPFGYENELHKMSFFLFYNELCFLRTHIASPKKMLTNAIIKYGEGASTKGKRAHQIEQKRRRKKRNEREKRNEEQMRQHQHQSIHSVEEKKITFIESSI